MLKSVQRKPSLSAKGANFLIVASRYNAQYVDSMLDAAKLTLERAGAARVEVLRVPGAYEIPTAAACAARHAKGKLSAIICLGVILRGATTHAQHIGEAVTNALSAAAIQFEVPMIHEVLLFENEKQAVERCLDPKRNRGIEAAQKIGRAHV